MSITLTHESRGLDPNYELSIAYLPAEGSGKPESHLYEVRGWLDLDVEVYRWVWSGEEVDLSAVQTLEDLPGNLGRQVIDIIYETNELN